ncbi:MAG: WG repeat-containing protein, partial [Sphingobacterium sp.]
MCKQILFLLLFLVSLSLKSQPFVDSPEGIPNKFWGFINLYDEGKNIPAIYHATGGFSEGFAAVSNGENWGYIDVHNNLVIDYQFDYAKSFHHQKAIVQKGEFYGVINRDGEFVIDPKYYDLQLFQLGNDQYYISRDSTFFQGVVDSIGQDVLAHEYS